MACSRSIAYLVVLGLGPVGCNDDDDGDDSTGSPSSSTASSSTGSAWLVGDEGEMLRLGADGEISHYPLDELLDLAGPRPDLLAIACNGASGAWVVGGDGTVIATEDAGVTWTRLDVGTTAELQAIALAENHHGELARVVIAGDGVLLSRGRSGAFTALPVEPLGYTAVALDHEGARLLAVTDEGSIWRIDGDATAERVASFDAQPLYGIAMDAAGEVAAAVGADGWLALSRDGGTSWEPQLLPTARDLWAVRIAAAGDLVLAVGDAGTVVRIDRSGTAAEEWLDATLALRAIHMHAAGAGHAVGDAGTVLFTGDLGQSWVPLDVPTDAILRGVDDVHAGAHF